MTLSIRGDISPNGITFKAACASGSNFLICTTESKLRQYSVSNSSLAFVASATLSGLNPSGITYIAPGSAALCYSGTNRIDIFNVNNIATTTAITTNAPETYRTNSQQIAGIPSLSLAMATNTTQGQITMVSLTCCAVISPTVLASNTARCVVVRPETNTWLFGTSNGKICEINSSGQILTVVNVVSAPFVVSPTICVNSLSYYNGTVLAVTDAGEMATYSWPGGVRQNVLPMNTSNSSSGSVLCASVSGTTLSASPIGITGNYKTISEMYFENGNLNIDATFFNESSAGVYETGIEPSGAYAWMINNSNSNLLVRIFNITSMSKDYVITRVQNPLGNDIAARIIRIRDDNGIGNACVELDQTIFPGAASLICTDSRNYIEIALQGNVVNGNPPYTNWDIREFQS